MARKIDPFTWKKATGLVLYPELRRYTLFIFPLLGRTWETDDVMNFTDTEKKAPEGNAKPFKFSKSRGVVGIDEARRVVAYIEDAVGSKIADRDPFQFAAKFKHLRFEDATRLSGHVERWITRLARTEEED
jgi:hypothetical protein